MIKTIFRNTILVGVLVLAICSILFFGLQYKQTIDETFEELSLETSYAIPGLELSGVDYLKDLCDANRVTWIDHNGDVLYDSEYEDLKADQSGYEEVADAFKDGVGESIRKSDNSGVHTIYYARLLEDGSVLRLSRPIGAAWYAFVAVSPVLWVLVLVLLLSGILAFRAAKQIVTPINNLDLDNHANNPYPELAPLLDKIQEQKMMIQEESSLREEMRREFSANVSHELKTPLTSISGFAELMATGNVSQDKVTEFSKDIYKESQRLISLINDIIKLSRLDENADLPPKEDVDLHELVLGVADDLKPAAGKNNIYIDVIGEDAHISGVRQLLYEMVYNLCDNAIKYNYPGGKVTMETVRDNKNIKLVVSDTGIGIPKEHQKRIFERFYRVDRSHSKEIGGTGLGLSIVKHGAIYHDADVTVDSTPGKGTTITITFPGESAE
ncbi:MAG: two-component sensor histidine kinase [Lachnospiraceae bacterium]|nr:two-component sensor histidine kinase [Lachnospiraceae bacterium]